MRTTGSNHSGQRLGVAHLGQRERGSSQRFRRKKPMATRAHGRGPMRPWSRPRFLRAESYLIEATSVRPAFSSRGRAITAYVDLFARQA
jgi:hypothetical protein